MYDKLERLQLKYDKLNYCRFCIQAEVEINPDFLENLEYNFSVFESIRGFTGRELMNEDGRPDKNLVYYYDKARHLWNKDPAHHYVQLYVVRHEGVESVRPTRTRPDKTRSVIYNFLETLRGRGAVNDVNKRMDDGISGLRATQDRIRDSVQVSRVDSAIDEIIEENERIQQGFQGR